MPKPPQLERGSLDSPSRGSGGSPPQQHIKFGGDIPTPPLFASPGQHKTAEAPKSILRTGQHAPAPPSSVHHPIVVGPPNSNEAIWPVQLLDQRVQSSHGVQRRVLPEGHENARGQAHNGARNESVKSLNPIEPQLPGLQHPGEVPAAEDTAGHYSTRNTDLFPAQRQSPPQVHQASQR
jgi:hypothetical protein